MNFTVYILRTSSNTFYTGQTNNLEKRLKEHRSKNSKSAKYMRRFESFELYYKEDCSTRTQALHREMQIKNLSHNQKEVLIKKAYKRPSKGH
jgi:putative endonuclease